MVSAFERSAKKISRLASDASRLIVGSDRFKELGRLDHILEFLQRANLDGGRSWLGVSPLHFAGLRVANLSLWKSLLLDPNDLCKIWDHEGTNAFLADCIGDFDLECVEDFSDLFLGQAGGFCDV